jgi:hypothetical protein
LIGTFNCGATFVSVALLCAVHACLLVPQILSSAHKDQIEDSFVTYILCKLASFLFCPAPYDPIPSEINCLNFFLIGTSGLVLFLTVGLSKSNVKLWRLSVNNLHEGRSFFHRSAAWESTTNFSGSKKGSKTVSGNATASDLES